MQELLLAVVYFTSEQSSLAPSPPRVATAVSDHVSLISDVSMFSHYITVLHIQDHVALISDVSMFSHYITVLHTQDHVSLISDASCYLSQRLRLASCVIVSWFRAALGCYISP